MLFRSTLPYVDDSCGSKLYLLHGSTGNDCETRTICFETDLVGSPECENI